MRKNPRFRFVMDRTNAHDGRRGPTSRLLLCLLALVAASAWLAPAAAARVNPQVAGLQVALRAYSVYAGPIDGISGPATRRGIKRFQRRVGLSVDGRAGRATRRAFGPLGRPLFGKRTIHRGQVGWDVSVMQILPGTWSYVETVLIGGKVPRTASGNIRVGVVYLRQLLREFGGSNRQALAAWYQGPTSVRKRGAIRETKIFVANVLALRQSSV